MPFKSAVPSQPRCRSMRDRNLLWCLTGLRHLRAPLVARLETRICIVCLFPFWLNTQRWCLIVNGLFNHHGYVNVFGVLVFVIYSLQGPCNFGEHDVYHSIFELGESD